MAKPIRLLAATWVGVLAAGGMVAGTLEALGAPERAAGSPDATLTVHPGGSPAPQAAPLAQASAAAAPAPPVQGGTISAGPLQGPLGSSGSGGDVRCSCAPVRHVVHRHVVHHAVRRTIVAAAPPPVVPLVPYTPVYAYRPLITYYPPVVPLYRPAYPVVVRRPLFYGRAWW